MMSYRSRSKGFTLVEIMIVVAIIGILLAIAVPGFLKARTLARENASRENMSKIDGAIQQYILEHNLPDLTAFIDGINDFDGFGDEVALWAGLDPDLIGPNGYLRVLPTCPAGGAYFIQNYEVDGDELLTPVVSIRRGEAVEAANVLVSYQGADPENPLQFPEPADAN